VGASAIDGATGRHQGLGGHLSAEGALALFLGVRSSIDIDLDWFKVEQMDEKLKGFGHPTIVALSSRRSPRGIN